MKINLKEIFEKKLEKVVSDKDNGDGLSLVILRDLRVVGRIGTGRVEIIRTVAGPNATTREVRS